MLEFAPKVRIIAQRSLSPLKGEVDANAVSRRRGVTAPTAESVSERFPYSLFEILRFMNYLFSSLLRNKYYSRENFLKEKS